jgi:hypothetical protein
MTSFKTFASIVLLSICAATWAAPAAWYTWRSSVNNYDICSQTSPGIGWRVVKGPFQDAHCKKKGTPKGSL